jgi:hypothetical protein
MLNTEAAWQSVSQYFPPEIDSRNRYYARRADQQLARWYMDQRQFERALTLLAELAELGPGEEQFRAFGLAGQALVHAERGEHAASAEKIAAVWPLREYLDSQLQAEVERLALRNRDALRQPPASTRQPSRE